MEIIYPRKCIGGSNIAYEDLILDEDTIVGLLTAYNYSEMERRFFLDELRQKHIFDIIFEYGVEPRYPEL